MVTSEVELSGMRLVLFLKKEKREKKKIEEEQSNSIEGWAFAFWEANSDSIPGIL